MPASAGELLEQLEPVTERVYLVGPNLAAGARAAWGDEHLPPGWAPAEAGHYLEGNLPIYRYRSPAGGLVTLHRAAGWYGEGVYSPAEAEAAHALMREAVRSSFAGGELLDTPATTGRELLLRSLPAGDWPVLEPEQQQLIRSTSGQGRIEPRCLEACCHWREAPAEVAGLAEYDGRLMYGALCWGLGAGPATRDTLDTYEGQRRGRYRVTFTIPSSWDHVGLLPVKLEGGDWHYPSAAGSSWETWVDGAELHVLPESWKREIRIRERLLLAPTSADPLGRWAKRLVAVREQLAGDQAEQQLARAGVRSILLHGLGALHGTEHRVTRSVPIAEAAAVPASAASSQWIEGGRIYWQHGTGQRWEQLAHPEWTSAVWARARARLLAGPAGVGALSVPRDRLVGFRTDAIYTDGRVSAWEAADDGKAGRFRLKGSAVGPFERPTSGRELLALRSSWKGTDR